MQSSINLLNSVAGPSSGNLRVTGASTGTAIGGTTGSDGPNVNTSNTKRGSIACRRCRRFRTKCLNDNGCPPCQACAKAGLSDECSFIRGNSSIDRRDTRPRKTDRHLRRLDGIAPYVPPTKSSESAGQPSTSSTRAVPEGTEPSRPESQPSPSTDITSTPETIANPIKGGDIIALPLDEGLPSTEEIEAILNEFFSTIFQVGFLHKGAFLSKFRQNRSQISLFLLLSILATSAAETPSVIARAGKEKAKAEAQVYFDRAIGMAFQEIAEPSLERIQAFYLLGQRDWTDGRGSRSWVFMGIAIRLANLLQLENASTYRATLESPPEVQIAEEEARRTVWHLLTADDCLSCSKGRPASDLSTRISIPMPCDEEDFLFGSIHFDPRNTATSTGECVGSAKCYLETKLTLVEYSCLVYALWGRAARLACSATTTNLPLPWANQSEYQDVLATAAMWTNSLSPRLRYTAINLSGHRSRQLDLPFVFIHLIFHACHIVIRRIYLANMVWSLHPGNAHASESGRDGAPPEFWQRCAHDQFEHAYQLIEIAYQYDQCGGLDTTISPLMAFGVFQAAAVLTYLLRWFWLCPPLFGDCFKTIQTAMHLLQKCKARFEMAEAWCETLDAAIRSAHQSSSSFLSATAARHLLEEDDYTVDPLHAVSPPKDPNSTSSSDALQNLNSRSNSSPRRTQTQVLQSNAQAPSIPHTQDQQAAVRPTVPALPAHTSQPPFNQQETQLQSQPAASQPLAMENDFSADFFSFENLQNTMFTSDMPLVGMQDLLDFTGDIGLPDSNSGLDRWTSTFDLR